LLPRNQTDITHAMAPALCAGTSGWLTISVDTDSHYRTLQWGSTGRGPDWGFYGPSRTWYSKPACAMKEDYAAGRPGFVIAGKLKSSDGNNNKIMASAGIMGPAALELSNPTSQTSFSPVDNTRTYVTGGQPSMASWRTSSGSGVLALTFMGDDRRTIYAHKRNLPYMTNSWSARVTGPTLPTGWTAIGAPSIVMEFFTFDIVVHARNGSTDALFMTHFFGDSAGTQDYFCDANAVPTLVWEQQASFGTINEDPWLVYTRDIGLNAYFRQGSQIIVANLYNGLPALPVRPSTGIQFVGAPAATAGQFFDMGTNVAIGRSSANRIYWTESNSDGHLAP
jgi:hypothetical protein